MRLTSSPLFQVTSLFCYPGHLEKLVHYVQSTGRRLNTLRHVDVGGSALSKQLAELTRSVFENLRSLKLFYGMTESNGCVCAPPKDVISYTDIGYPAIMNEIKVTKFHIFFSGLFVFLAEPAILMLTMH